MKFRYLLIPAIVLSALGAGLTSSVSEQIVEGKCAIGSTRSSLSAAKAVFAGEVIAEEKNGDVKTFTFRIEKFWKGEDTKEANVFVYQTMRFQSPFKEGEKFLVYARADEEGRLTVSRCSRSKRLDYAEDDLRELGAGKTPK